MRRERSLREHRDKLLSRRKITTIAERRKQAQEKLRNRKKSRVVVHNVPGKPPTETVVQLQEKDLHTRDTKRAQLRKNRQLVKRSRGQPKKENFDHMPAASEAQISFKDYNTYQYDSRIVNVCHVIESLGLGGGQTMMFELVNGLNNYYGKYINNHILCVNRTEQKTTGKLIKSYGVFAESVVYADLREYLQRRKIDVVLHHRLSMSSSLKKYLPEECKYILLNHTWNSMNKIADFIECDFFVSVCQFLNDRTNWRLFIHDTRKIVILNGVENKYIKDIPEASLNGSFKTGRCHRLVSSKFRIDSLNWMNKHVAKVIPNFSHHLIGVSKHAKAVAHKYKEWFTYHGSTEDRKKKMSIIKALDLYYYETFSDEGASMAILESLAAGVPVLCKPLGGTPEIVINGVNGFLAKDRQMLLLRIKQLATNSEMLKSLKEQTVQDFENRLHVKYTACKYMQLFEWFLKGEK